MLQQLVSMPNMQDKTQKMMLFIMPVMFYFISLQFPAGLCLYWIFYGLITAVQTLYVNFRLKIGFFASPEDKIKRKEAQATAQAEKAQPGGGKNKSQNKADNDNKEQRQQVHTHTCLLYTSRYLPWQSSPL